jgi:hypothetical protein
MAKRLDTFPTPAGARYPWEEWLDGSVWELRQGQDFTAKLPTFRANAQTQAKKRGGVIRSRRVEVDGGEAVVIQFERS